MNWCLKTVGINPTVFILPRNIPAAGLPNEGTIPIEIKTEIGIESGKEAGTAIGHENAIAQKSQIVMIDEIVLETDIVKGSPR
jgi:hypothetical protein